jgi:hypothetical protein
MTTVHCSATDAAGNTGTGSFTVTVRDVTAPVLSLPSPISVKATSPAVAVVTFTATSQDDDGQSYPVTCTPASGSIFPIGTNTVHCSATDAAGNTGTGTFQVIVQPVLTASGKSVSPTEGSVFNGVVATGTAYGAGTLTATITWGDTSSASAGTLSVASDGSYSVAGSHTYAEEGSFAIKVTVSGSGGLSATGPGTATVIDAALTASTPTATIKGLNVTLTTKFSDADPAETTSDYTANITWGDSSAPTAATIGSSGVSFTATGTHKYAKH